MTVQLIESSVSTKDRQLQKAHHFAGFDRNIVLTQMGCVQ
jgi:hypothetical protein